MLLLGSVSDKLDFQLRFNESDTDLYSTSHPFKFVKVNKSVSEYGEIGFDVSTDTSEPKIVTPEDVGGEVLKYLLGITAKFLGHTQVQEIVSAINDSK